MFTRSRVVTETPADETDSQQEVSDRRTVETSLAAWSPLQIVGLVIGIGYAVLGIVAVNRTGFDTSNIYQPHVMVWKLPHSPLLGVIEIGFGVLLVLGSVVPGGWRAFVGFLGAVAVAFGIVVLVESIPNRLNGWLGVTHRSGLVFLVSGAVLVLASLLSPVFFVAGVHRRERLVPRDRILT